MNTPGHELMSDEQIIKRIITAKKWATIFQTPSTPTGGIDHRAAHTNEILFVTSEFSNDRNAAHLAFCNFIAHFSSSAAQVKRIWNKSILWIPWQFVGQPAWNDEEKHDEYRNSIIEKALVESCPFVDTGVRVDIQWLWDLRLPKGKLVMLDGDPGLSKSMFMLKIAVSVMFGKKFLDGEKPAITGGVVLLSAEDDLRDTIVPRLLAAGAPDGQIPMIHVPSSKPDGTQFSLADINDRYELEHMIAQADAKLVIIDPINSYLGERVDSHNDQKIRQVLAPLSEIANRTGCVIVGLRHVSKGGSGGKAVYRGLGSIGYTAAARVNFFIAGHPDETDVYVFACSKTNLGPKPPSIKYRLDFAKVEGISKPVPFVAHGETCDLTADQLSEAQAQNKGDDREGSDKVENAVEFLRLVLSDGRVTRSEVDRKAAQQKIKPITLRRAQQLLKIKPQREGNKSWWELPEEAKVVQAVMPF
jgi:AAA domain